MQTLDELVTANKVLSGEGLVDSFGYVCVRNPERSDRFFLNRIRSPGEKSDLIEFNLDGTTLNMRVTDSLGQVTRYSSTHL